MTRCPPEDSPLHRQLLAYREAAERRILEVEGAVWRYSVLGEGPPLLLIPGGFRSAESAFGSALTLSSSWRVLVPDLPIVPTMPRLTGGLAALLHHEGIEQAPVMGRSFGGVVAQCLVRDHPGLVECLVLACTSAPVGEKLARQTRTALGLVRFLPGGVVRWMFRSQLTTIATRGTPAQAQAFWRWYVPELFDSQATMPLTEAHLVNQLELGLDLLERYSWEPKALDGWPGSVLLLFSEDDLTTPEAVRESTTATYPRAQVRLFPSGGHSPGLVHGEAYRAAIDAFLVERGEQGSASIHGDAFLVSVDPHG